jgi:nitrite reductase/ring-hydroxylating ferredoxin subunit
MIDPNLPTQWVRVAQADQIPAGKARLVHHGRLELIVFHTDDGWTAFDNTCPHAGAPIYAEHFDGHCVTCIYHGLRFRASDGGCVDAAGWDLEPYAVKVEGEHVLVGFPQKS